MELRLRTTHTLLRKVLIKDTEEIKHCSKRPWGMSKRVPRTTAQPRSGKLGCRGTKCYKGKTGVELQSALLRAILDHLTAFTYSRKNVKKNIIAKMNRFETTNHLISNLIKRITWFQNCGSTGNREWSISTSRSCWPGMATTEPGSVWTSLQHVWCWRKQRREDSKAHFLFVSLQWRENWIQFSPENLVPGAQMMKTLQRKRPRRRQQRQLWSKQQLGSLFRVK